MSECGTIGSWVERVVSHGSECPESCVGNVLAELVRLVQIDIQTRELVPDALHSDLNLLSVDERASRGDVDDALSVSDGVLEPVNHSLDLFRSAFAVPHEWNHVFGDLNQCFKEV